MIGDPEPILEQAAEKLANGEYESALKGFEFLKQVHRDFQPDWYWDSMIGRCLVAQNRSNEAMPFLVSAYKETLLDRDVELWNKASLFVDLSLASLELELFEQGRDYAHEGMPYVMGLDRNTYHHDRYLFFSSYALTCVHLDDYKEAVRYFSLSLSDKIALNKEEEARTISFLHFELFRAYSFDGDWGNACLHKDQIQLSLLDLERKRSWHYVMLYYLYNGCDNKGREILQVFEQYKSMGIDDVYLANSLYFAAAAYFELQDRVMARKLILEAIEAGLAPGYREYAEQLVKVLDGK